MLGEPAEVGELEARRIAACELDDESAEFRHQREERSEVLEILGRDGEGC